MWRDGVSRESGEGRAGRAIAIERRALVVGGGFGEGEEEREGEDEGMDLACDEKINVLQDRTNTMDMRYQLAERYQEPLDCQEESFYDPFLCQKFSNLECRDESLPPQIDLRSQNDDFLGESRVDYKLESFKTDSKYKFYCNDE